MNRSRERIDSVVHDLSIPLDFDGAQPNHFGAPPASALPLAAGDFTGSVEKGGSCECTTLTLTPHCNGTHTETVRHLLGAGPAPYEALLQPLVDAYLASVTPMRAEDCTEGSDPAPNPGDLLVTRAALADAVPADATAAALIVRTLPNDAGKRRADWSERPAPFFTREAMQWLVEQGFEHLLFDGPSLDRAHDEGKLTAHRVFFGLPPGSMRLQDVARPMSTVTEMIFVPDAVADGAYRLSLQVPAFRTDAAPSRPLLLARLAA